MLMLSVKTEAIASVFFVLATHLSPQLSILTNNITSVVMSLFAIKVIRGS